MFENAVLMSPATTPIPAVAAKRNQSDDESVLDEVLALFAAKNVLKLNR